MLRQVKLYHRHQQKTLGSFPILPYLYKMVEDFDDLRIGMSPTMLGVATTQSVQQPPTNTAATSFKCSIKRDPAVFTSLKDNSHWDKWNDHTVAQARMQDVIDIFVPNYSPTTILEQELFKLKQNYVYAVFADKLETDYGRTIVRKHRSDSDTQEVYRKLLEHALRSTKADTESSNLLAYLTTAQFGADTWRGTSESFILHWIAQLRQYEDQVDA